MESGVRIEDEGKIWRGRKDRGRERDNPSEVKEREKGPRR